MPKAAEQQQEAIAATCQSNTNTRLTHTRTRTLLLFCMARQRAQHKHTHTHTHTHQRAFFLLELHSLCFPTHLCRLLCASCVHDPETEIVSVCVCASSKPKGPQITPTRTETRTHLKTRLAPPRDIHSSSTDTSDLLFHVPRHRIVSLLPLPNLLLQPFSASSSIRSLSRILALPVSILGNLTGLAIIALASPLVSVWFFGIDRFAQSCSSEHARSFSPPPLLQ